MYGNGPGSSGGYGSGSGPENPWNSHSSVPRMGMVGERRDPALLLVLCVLTCGVYYLYYLYRVSEEAQRFLEEPDTSPAVEVLLTVVTCGLYNIYWDYKMGKKIARMQERVGLPPADNAWIYVIIDVFGHGLIFGLINALIQQGHLNEIWHRAGQSYGQPRY